MKKNRIRKNSNKNRKIIKIKFTADEFLKKSKILVEEKKWKEADILFLEMRKEYPDRSEGFIRGGVALRNLGKIDEALELFNISIENHQQNINNKIQKAVTLMQIKKWEEAHQLWSELRISHPNRPQGFRQGGIALKNLGRIEEAKEIFIEALRFDENNSLVVNNLKAIDKIQSKEAGK